MTDFIAAGFFARTIFFALAVPLAERRAWETPFLADFVIAAVRLDLAVRAVLVAAVFRLTVVLTVVRVRGAALFTDFVAAAARAGFARRTTFFGIALPLTGECAREATLLTVFFAAVALAGFARRTVFFGIAFPFATGRVREVLLFAVRVRDVAAFVSITTYPTLVENSQKLTTLG
jgi:hypothetical protein